MEPWRGKNWEKHGILILGESWYSDVVDLNEYVEKWAAGTLKDGDYLFSRLFNICMSDANQHTSGASYETRKAFWDAIAFHNFIPWSIGKTNKERPKENKEQNDYERAACVFEKKLFELQPRRIWILGKTQARYSKPIVCKYKKSCECHYKISFHPCYRRGATTESLVKDWKECIGDIKLFS